MPSGKRIVSSVAAKTILSKAVHWANLTIVHRQVITWTSRVPTMATAHMTRSWSPWAVSSLTLWNNSGHLHHQDMVLTGEHQLMMAGTGMVSGRQVPTKGRGHNRTTTQTVIIKHSLATMATNKAVGLVIEVTSQEGITPGSMKLGQVVNVTQYAQSCQTLKSTWRRRLHLWQPH